MATRNQRRTAHQKRMPGRHWTMSIRSGRTFPEDWNAATYLTFSQQRHFENKRAGGR